MTSLETCTFKPFVSQVVPPKADLDALASGMNLLVGQLENYFRELLASICRDLQQSGSAESFLELSDTPNSYAGAANFFVRVNAGETGLTFFAATLVTTFLQLSDTPNSYAGASLFFVRVNVGETALEFFDLNAILVTTFLGLSDTPNSYAGAALQIVRVNAAETDLEFFTEVFTALGDVPNSYAGQANKVVVVNPAETGLAFSSVTVTDVDALQSLSRTIMAVIPNEANGFSSLGAAPVLIGASLTTTRPTTGSSVSGRERGVAASTSGTNRYAGVRNGGVGMVFRGNNAGEGGFRFTAVFGTSSTATLAQQKGFVGLCANANLPVDGTTTTQPSAFTDTVFVGYDSTGTTLVVMHNDNAGACTQIPLGAGFPVDLTTLYRARFTCPPNNSNITYEIINTATGAIATGVISTNLPTNTTNMFPMMFSGSGTTNGVARLPFGSMVLESYAY